jgi:hypothetical protein
MDTSQVISDPSLCGNTTRYTFLDGKHVKQVYISLKTRGGMIGPAFIPVTPDTGATKSTITTGSLKKFFAFYKSPKCNWKVMSVPEYTVLLADNSRVVSNQKVEADLTLIIRTGKVLIPGIVFNVIFGPPAPLLIGKPELSS